MGNVEPRRNDAGDRALLSAVRDAMHEAFESNLEFMTRMAEIQSISPGVSTSLDSIAEHVADLSRQFNVPIAQVAEAQYQAISNQFTTTAQQTELLTAALKLSKVAVMDAGQAVNLVAGAERLPHGFRSGGRGGGAVLRHDSGRPREG